MQCCNKSIFAYVASVYVFGYKKRNLRREVLVGNEVCML